MRLCSNGTRPLRPHSRLYASSPISNSPATISLGPKRRSEHKCTSLLVGLAQALRFELTEPSAGFHGGSPHAQIHRRGVMPFAASAFCFSEIAHARLFFASWRSGLSRTAVSAAATAFSKFCNLIRTQRCCCKPQRSLGGFSAPY